MKAFIDTYACRSKAHCLACRSDEHWREQVFAPLNCPWDEDPPPLFSTVRHKICISCGWTCRLGECSECYRTKYLATPREMCPEGHWSSIERAS